MRIQNGTPLAEVPLPGAALLGTTLTGIGFDLPTSGGSVTLLSPNPNNTGFAFSTSAGNVPQYNSANLDFALLTGKNFAGGNPPSGLSLGQSSATYTVQGDFDSLSQLQLAQSAFVRFQSIPGRVGSDVGHSVVPPPVVPEPGTFALAGIGLLPLAGAVLRRRKAS